LFKVKLKICEQHIDSIGLQLFFLVAMASAKAEQVTKEKLSFATETTMPACRSLSKIPFNFKQLHF
jgi:hypothetical protein